MDEITPSMIWQAVLVVLALCGVVGTVGKAIDVLRSCFDPGRKRDQRLAACEAKLDRDHKRLTALEEGNRELCRAMLALLNHEITGNSVDKLKVAQEALTSYLVEK